MSNSQMELWPFSMVVTSPSVDDCIPSTRLGHVFFLFHYFFKKHFLLALLLKLHDLVTDLVMGPIAKFTVDVAHIIIYGTHACQSRNLLHKLFCLMTKMTGSAFSSL